MNKIFTKDALDKLLGKESSSKPIRLVSMLRYVWGILTFDSILEEKYLMKALGVYQIRGKKSDK